MPESLAREARLQLAKQMVAMGKIAVLTYATEPPTDKTARERYDSLLARLTIDMQCVVEHMERTNDYASAIAGAEEYLDSMDWETLASVRFVDPRL